MTHTNPPAKGPRPGPRPRQTRTRRSAEKVASDRTFMLGVLHALAFVKNYDQGTLFDEIVAETGREELIRAALSDQGTAEFSGLEFYGYVKNGRAVSEKRRKGLA